MHFGLRNIGATYQRLVNQMFKEQIGRNMEVYVDDILVKSREPKQHVKDLIKALEVLQRYKMKLNQIKCTFGVGSDKFLGFKVSKRGNETKLRKGPSNH